MAVDEGEGVARESLGVAPGTGVGAGVWDSCVDWALHTPQTGKGDLILAFVNFFFFNVADFNDAALHEKQIEFDKYVLTFHSWELFTLYLKRPSGLQDLLLHLMTAGSGQLHTRVNTRP